MTDVIKEDQVLDCSGMLCPMPVVKTSKAMKELQSGQILKLVATDPGAPPDMEAWSRQTGNFTNDKHDLSALLTLRKKKIPASSTRPQHLRMLRPVP